MNAEMVGIIGSVFGVLGVAGSIIFGVMAIRRAGRQERKGSEEEIRECAKKEASTDAKLDVAVQGILEVKSKMERISDKIGDHDRVIAGIQSEVRGLNDRLDQHLNTHPPNARAAE